MPTTPEQRLVNDSRKMTALVAKGLASPEGVARHILALLAVAEAVDYGAAPRMWEAIPEDIRPTFVDAGRAVSRPDYHYRHFGFGDTRTPEERERDIGVHTARLRAWAAQFARLWGAGAESP